MKLIVTLEKGEDGYIIAECPSIPGCISQGTTRDEAIDNIKEAIALCLQARRAGLALKYKEYAGLTSPALV